MDSTGFSRDDMRAAVASGILTEAQAARVLTLAETRSGVRAGQTGEDEPFELFRGFSEIFISVGLVLLVAGLTSLAALVKIPAVVIGAAIILCFALAGYFTRMRRMVLPSIVLVTGYGFSVVALVSYLSAGATIGFDPLHPWTLAVTAAALALWYFVYRLPFTMFLLGLTGLAIVFSATQSIAPQAEWGRISDAFDLRAGSGLAFGTLVFGLAAFVAAMRFDMRDPHRLGRIAAAGFWLHLLAAPALVNTVALTFWNMGNALGHVALALSLALITLLALAIDRRSFLTAGIGYFAVLLAVVLRASENDMSWAGILLILGLFVTTLGAFWNQTRSALMRALPDFPGKGRLPPYSETA